MCASRGLWGIYNLFSGRAMSREEGVKTRQQCGIIYEIPSVATEHRFFPHSYQCTAPASPLAPARSKTDCQSSFSRERTANATWYSTPSDPPPLTFLLVRSSSALALRFTILCPRPRLDLSETNSFQRGNGFLSTSDHRPILKSYDSLGPEIDIRYI